MGGGLKTTPLGAKFMTKEWYKLSNKKLQFLYRYYLVLFFLGCIITILSLVNESVGLNYSVTIISIVGGVGCALMGSMVFYLRKLYKSCINVEFDEPATPEDFKREIGVFYYYFLRPIISIGFSLFINIALRTSISIVTIKETNLSNGFIYLVMFLSFFGGFASGDLITLIEQKGNKVISTIFKEK